MNFGSALEQVHRRAPLVDCITNFVTVNDCANILLAVGRLLSLAKVNIGLCLVGVIIGEFISSKCGLGYLIIYASQVFKMDWMLMSIVILCMISMGLYGLIGFAEKWYQKRMG